MAASGSGNNAFMSFVRDVMNGHMQLPFKVSVPFISVCLVIVFIYITNHLAVEKQIREIADLTNEIKELQYEQISTQSELMNMSKQSEVLRRIQEDNIGLKELTEPPRIVER